MAKTVIDELLISIGFDTAEINKTSRDLENIISQSMGRIKSMIGAVIGIDAFKDMLTGFAQVGSQLEFMSQKFGTSVKSLNAWQEGVKRFGGTAEGFTGTLTSLNNAIQDVAVTGGGQIGGLLAAIGVRARDSEGKIRPTVDVLKDLGQVFKGMDRNRAMYLQRQLGIDDGTFRMLLMGKQQLNDYLGVMAKQSVMDDARANKALILKRKLDDLNQAWTNIKITIGTALIPVFNVLESIFTRLSNQYIPKIISGVESFEKSLGLSKQQMDSLIKVVKVGLTLLAGFAGFNLAIKTLGGSLAMVAGGFGMILKSVTAIMSPIGALVTAMTVLYTLYKEISTTSNANLAKAGQDLAAGHPLDALKDLGKDGQQDMSGSGGVGGSGIFLNPNIKSAWDLLKSGHPIDAFKALNKQWQEPSNMSAEMQGIWKGLSPHEKAQLMQESGGKNIVGDNGRSFGLFQIQPETASRDAWGGAKVTGQQLMNPQFNLETYRRLQAKYLQEAHGNQMAADARYNGGLGGQNHFLKTGQSYNGYAEKIAGNAPMYRSEAVSKGATNNSHTQQTNTVNVNGDISLPSVKNAQDFTNQLQQYSNPLNITRSMNNFQSGRSS